MRLLALTSLAVIVCACPDPAAPPPPADAVCDPGKVRDESGRCVLAVPAAPCPPGTRGVPGSADCVPMATSDCAEGFVPAPSGWGCREVSSATCPRGTKPVLGSEACEPVGFTACPAGFAQDSTLWTCQPVLGSGCTGASRRAIGQAGCVPIGDCTAAFPPAGATLFVDAALDPAKVDATHFRTLGDAVAAAPANAVVAVAAGNYSETVAFSKPVTLVGRCPDQVRWAPPSTSSRIATADGVRGVEVRGVWFEQGIVVVQNGGELKVSDAVSNSAPVSAFAVLDASAANPSRLVLERVVVRGLRADANGLAMGALVERGAVLEATDLDVYQASYTALSVADKNARLVLDRAVIGPVRAGPTGIGRALWLSNATARITASQLGGGAGSAIDVLGSSQLDLAKSTLRSVKRIGGLGGSGVVVKDASSATLTDVSILDAEGGGVFVEGKQAKATLERVTVRNAVGCTDAKGCAGEAAVDGGQFVARRSAFLSNQTVGVFAARGASARLEDSLVAGTKPSMPGGEKLDGIGLVVRDGADVTASRVAFLSNASDAIVLLGGHLALDYAVVRRNGNGAVAARGDAVAEVTRSLFADNGLIHARAYGPGAPNAPPGAARVVLDQVVMRETRGDPAIVAAIGGMAAWGGILEVRRSTIDGVGQAGLAVLESGSRMVVDGSVVMNTHPGDGSTGTGLSIDYGGAAEISGSAFVGNSSAGVQLVDAAGATLTLRDSRIVASSIFEGRYGYGLLVGPGASAIVSGTDLGANSAVALAVDSGAAVVSSTLLADSPVGAHVSGSASIEQRDALPSAPEKDRVLIDATTVFARTPTRLGAGDLPLPPAVKLPAN